jgi:hypothetical protein
MTTEAAYLAGRPVSSTVRKVEKNLVCKIINGHMFVGDVGEVSCGSKVGAIAVLCGMLRSVSQF